MKVIRPDQSRHSLPVKMYRRYERGDDRSWRPEIPPRGSPAGKAANLELHAGARAWRGDPPDEISLPRRQAGG